MTWGIMNSIWPLWWTTTKQPTKAPGDGCICYENTAMGLYFIHDPDDYWIEIIPEKR